MIDHLLHDFSSRVHKAVELYRRHHGEWPNTLVVSRPTYYILVSKFGPVFEVNMQAEPVQADPEPKEEQEMPSLLTMAVYRCCLRVRHYNRSDGGPLHGYDLFVRSQSWD